MPTPENEHVVAIGASTGGIEALKILLEDLPAEFPAPILVVLHIGAHGLNSLDRILGAVTALRVANAHHGQRIEPGHVYVAVADRHLLVERGGRLATTRGPKENRSRPAIDPLFRSVAAVYGPGAIGVVLTGALDDGTSGLWAIKEQGGIAVVQRPDEAVASGMPRSAIEQVEVDHVVALHDMGPLLTRLVSEPRPGERSHPSADLDLEIALAQEETGLERGVAQWGKPSLLACPECHGVLLQREQGGNVRFRCHTGHAYGWETLLAQLAEKTEENLWNVIRAVEETTLLLKELADRPPVARASAEMAALNAKIEATRQFGNRVRQLLQDADEGASLPAA